MKQALDYYPYGAPRINTGTDASDRRFIGQFADDATSLDYLNARYYDPARGQFTSQDLVFLGERQNLADPQSMNSYSYANGNPINKSDPNGLSAKSTLTGLLSQLASALQSLIGASGGGSSVSGTSGSNMPKPVMGSQIPKPTRATTWDATTDKRIAELDPRVRQPATNFINDTQDWTGVKLRANEGYRSVSDQDKYYAQGRTAPGNIVTNAKGGESYHNYGKAMDVVIMTNGQPDWSKQITPAIAAYGKQQGFEWGGDWKGQLRDYPHFQMSLGQSIPR